MIKRSLFNIRLLKIVLYAICGMVLFFLVAPVFIVIPMSFSSATYLEFPPKSLSLQWYQDYFGGHKWLSATYLSFIVGILTMLLSSFLGTLAAFGLVRGRFIGKSIFYSLILSPMIIPVIVVAIALYFFYSKLQLIGTYWAVVFGHVAIATPFVVVIVSSTLQGFDETLEYAAMSLGANRLKTYYYVTFPIIKLGILSGALFAFITSFDELLIALFLCGYKGTIPKVMWEGIRVDITPTISAVSSLLIIFSLVIFGMYVLVKMKSDSEGYKKI